MSNVPDNAFLRRSQRLYACLLVAYPKRHREEYGPAMQQVFRDQCRDAWRDARGWGLTMVWLRALLDLLKTSFVERLLTIQGNTMSHRFARFLGFHSNPRVVFLRTAVAVFVAVFGATALTTFLMPKRFTSVAQLHVRCVLREGGTSSANPPLSAEEQVKGERIMAGEEQLIQSDALLERVVKSQSLETRWGKTGANAHKLTTGEAVALLRSRLKVSVPPRSNVIKLRVNSDDANEATRIAGDVIDAYLAERRDDTERRMQHIRSTVGPDVLRTRPLHEFIDITNVRIIHSPTLGDRMARPYIPGCLLMGGAGGLFLALVLGVVVTTLATRRALVKPTEPPTGSASAAA